MQGKEISASNAPAHVHVGIDVCKDWLDVFVHPVGLRLRLANDALGLKRLKRQLASFPAVSIVMEATAKYHRLPARSLHASGFCVAVINPARARSFASALGALAKTDRLDARILALFGEAIAPRATPPAPQNTEHLQELVNARQGAVADRTALQNLRGAAVTAFLRAELKRRIAALQTHIERLDAEIARLIKRDPVIARRVDILQSIPGVGPIVAGAMAVGLAEMGACSNKKIALLAGLAPIAADSGDKTGQRHIRGGRSRVRSAIYMAALTAARFNPDLKTFYDRLLAVGKPSKLAITAVMRKLVALANTLVTQNRLWTPART